MKKALLRGLLISACAFAPVVTLAGGIDAQTSCCAVRVDIPEMREGWGYTIEAAALRGYNNDLSYVGAIESSTSTTASGNTFWVNDYNTPNVEPNYDFALLLGVDYTFADSGNMIKLFYEHLFNTTGSGTIYDSAANEYEGSIKLKLDGVSLLSEQHILVGSVWEATFSGGLRYARVSQDLTTVLETAAGFPELNGSPASILGYGNATMQFNGVGPLVGLGGIFHLTQNFMFGAQTQAALLVGKNDTNLVVTSLLPAIAVLPAFESITRHNIANDIYSVVPELYGRIYGNYVYRCADGMELQIEAGWRMNQFFNLRTTSVGVTDDIGFSGPYLMGHVKL